MVFMIGNLKKHIDVNKSRRIIWTQKTEQPLESYLPGVNTPVRNEWLFGICFSSTYCATFLKIYHEVKSKFTFISCKIFFSNLETCTCEIPSRSATSDCVWSL